MFANFTTIGFGDVVVAQSWRLFAALEGANGLLLFWLVHGAPDGLDPAGPGV